jgi:hypothetical protein
MKLLTTSLLILLGALLGFCLCLLLPYVFVAWLSGWIQDTWASIAGIPHRCDGGELPSPTGEEERCRHGINPPDNCLMCAIEAPDDEPGETPLTKSILRNEWVNGVELWLEMQKGRKGKP